MADASITRLLRLERQAHAEADEHDSCEAVEKASGTSGRHLITPGVRPEHHVSGGGRLPRMVETLGRAGWRSIVRAPRSGRCPALRSSVPPSATGEGIVCGWPESRPRDPTCQVPWGPRARGSWFFAEEDRPASREGSRSRPIRQWRVLVCGGDSPERALHRSNEVCRGAMPNVAPARECPPVPECVPVSYPRAVMARQHRQHFGARNKYWPNGGPPAL